MLLTTEQVRRVERDWDARNHSILHGVPLPRGWFTVPQQGADVLLQRLSGDGGCCVLLEAAVRYTGDDPGLATALSGPVNQGWRALCAIAPANPELVLGRLEVILGLAGTPPSLAPPTARVAVSARPEGGSKAGAPAHDFGVDLVAEARAGRLEPALFREAETDTLIRIVTKEGKHAAALVGEAGVGKTKVVEHLAVRIAAGRVPDSMRDARILDVNLAFLAAGATAVNEFEGRLKRILDSARHDRDTILFIDELHLIASPLHQAAQLVKPDLGRGRIRCIGATTPGEYRIIAEDAALARRFQTVPVLELSAEQTLTILQDCAARLAAFHDVEITPDLLRGALELSRHHVPDRRLPDKAIDLLDEACALARMEADCRPGDLKWPTGNP